MDPRYCVALLTPQDVEIAREIRLEALQDSPEVFGGTYEEEVLYSHDKLKEQLTTDKTFGLFFEDKIVGCVTFGVTPLKKNDARRVSHRNVRYPGS